MRFPEARGSAPEEDAVNRPPALRRGSWPVPEVFSRIQKAGKVAEAEMLRTFNMGIGMCAVVSRGEAARAIDVLARRGQPAFEIGAIESVKGLGEPEVVVA